MSQQIKTTTIPLHQIELDQVIDITLKKLHITHTNKVKNYSHIIGKTLCRMDSMLEAFREKVSLPPVKLRVHKLYVPPRKRDDVEYLINCTSYEIVDGRHRVAASIIHGMDHIEAILL